ncbi:hypothetical protein ACJIZ3_016234 [Penstemon smallii]|uniref:Uncharacterized protein n=1 Tax=Penstemon smallii TaxID=265156 RepID=A0ABD3RT28_9LAMI
MISFTQERKWQFSRKGTSSLAAELKRLGRFCTFPSKIFFGLQQNDVLFSPPLGIGPMSRAISTMVPASQIFYVTKEDVKNSSPSSVNIPCDNQNDARTSSKSTVSRRLFEEGNMCIVENLDPCSIIFIFTSFKGISLRDYALYYTKYTVNKNTV